MNCLTIRRSMTWLSTGMMDIGLKAKRLTGDDVFGTGLMDAAAFHWCGITPVDIHCVSKKVPTLILSETLSNLNQFSHFCMAGKHTKFAIKPIRHYPSRLRHVATLPWEIKDSNFWSPVNCVGVQQRFKQLINTMSSISQEIQLSTSSMCTPSNTNFLLISCTCRWIPSWMLTNTAVTSAVTNFRCHKLIAKVNNQTNSDMKNCICNQYGERHPILSTENIKTCGQITKSEVIRMQYACIFFHVDWISAEIWICNFPRYCSNMPKVRWAVSYGFCTNFHTQNFENWLKFDKVTQSLKEGTFWHTV